MNKKIIFLLKPTQHENNLQATGIIKITFKERQEQNPPVAQIFAVEQSSLQYILADTFKWNYLMVSLKNVYYFILSVFTYSVVFHLAFLAFYSSLL